MDWEIRGGRQGRKELWGTAVSVHMGMLQAQNLYRAAPLRCMGWLLQQLRPRPDLPRRLPVHRHWRRNVSDSVK